MNTSEDIIVKNLFHKNNLTEVTELELETYVKKFPFASVGHLLLAKKKKETGSDYRTAASNAALFVPNPLWIHTLLDEIPGYNTTEQSQDIQHIIPALEVLVEESVEEKSSNFDELQPLQESESQPENSNQVNAQSFEISSLETKIEVEPLNADIEAPELPPLKTSFIEQDSGVLSFEPYHTIDYFASQGIKLRAEDLTKDKFGRQLKSFTEWLRTMKRLGPAPGDAASQPIDLTIQKRAEESIENNEVDTEAMAEVWIKQGKRAKAIEIYQKLSLLNPSKNHYFAAKIEQLNGL